MFRTARHIYAQIIDDVAAHTLVSASSLEKEFTRPEGKGKVKDAKAVGSLVARRALGKGSDRSVFDRNGFKKFSNFGFGKKFHKKATDYLKKLKEKEK